MKNENKAHIDITAFSQDKRASGSFLYSHSTSILIGFGVSFFAIILISLVQVIVLPLLMVWSALLPAYLWYVNKIGTAFHRSMLLQFAADNDYALLDDLRYLSTGVIFQAGNNDHSTGPRLEGGFYGYPVALYTHTYSLGAGRYQITNYYGVVEIDLPTTLPHIFIDSKKNNFLGFERLDIFHSQDVIELEGDFNKDFRIFVSKEYEIEALTLLNPGFMEELLKHSAGYEIELAGNKTYIYIDNIASLESGSIMEMFEAAEFLLVNLNKQLDTFRFNVHERIPNQIRKSILKQLI